MQGDLTIRKTRTASGATAIQVVRYEATKCIVVKHIGSAHSEQECSSLLLEAETYAECHRVQPSLFVANEISQQLDLKQTQLVTVTHHFIREVLLGCAQQCGLRDLPELFLDLAMMRIVEPASKLRTIGLLQRYFNVHYAQRTVYRLLPTLLDHQAKIEQAAIETADQEFNESFSLILYDVTTLYFESFKEYDLQRPGFSKDNKSQQPQVVIGLITTRSGFPLMHEVFEGNTFEGHTMLQIVKRFQVRMGEAKPVIVADAAMLSQANMQQLELEGYHYIVGARLANTTSRFIDQIQAELPHVDHALKRFTYAYAKNEVSIICEYSTSRYKKDMREFNKQVIRANELLKRNEPGRRAKFIKKSTNKDKPFIFDQALKTKTEKLLGIKGYVTNLSELEMSDAQIVAYYHDLWHVEQAFRMSKSDLRSRPIFHHNQDAIRAHLMLCFMALMMGKYVEIKAGISLRQIRDTLWNIHEAHVKDKKTGKVHVLRMNLDSSIQNILNKVLNTENTY